MKIEKLLHTPDGVRDIYNGQSAAYRELETRLRRVFLSFGYSDVQTPTFEFFDVFSSERGSVPSRELYKFFDHDGNTLVLRPDMTPAIARVAAKYYGDLEIPVRLSYTANTFINHSNYTGHLKERTQAGCECMGYGDVDADAEIIALLIESLRHCGVTEFKIELGQVNYFKGLVEEAGIDADAASELKALINMKNFYAAEDYCKRLGLSDSLSAAFVGIQDLFGKADCLEKARKMTSNTTALEAIDHLQTMYGLLKAYGMEEHLIFDLGMFGNYEYYTGVVFRAFTYGSGEPIGAGGRYDGLMKQFGKDVPAIGFGLALDSVMAALESQGVSLDVDKCETLVLFEPDDAHEGNIIAITLAAKMRADGENVRTMKRINNKPVEDSVAAAKGDGFTRVIYVNGSDIQEM